MEARKSAIPYMIGIINNAEDSLVFLAWLLTGSLFLLPVISIQVFKLKNSVTLEKSVCHLLIFSYFFKKKKIINKFDVQVSAMTYFVVNNILLVSR